jgi:hypothetical protein
MKKLYILIVILALAFNGNSQTFEWLKIVQIDYEYNPDMIQYSTCTDDEGNIYFFGLQELDLFYNQAMGSQFLKKYNPIGELEWERIITGEGLASGIYCDKAGGVYLYGQMHSNLDFWGETILNIEGTGTNGFLVKINYGGAVDWGMNLEDLPMESGTVSDMTSDDSNLLYVAYSTWVTSNIVIINSDGDYITSIVQDDVSIVSGVDVDDNGNIYAAGGCAGFYSTFGGVSYPAPFSYSSYIVKYNSGHEPEWVKFIEDVTCTFLKVKCDVNGGIYAASQLFAGTMLDTIVVQGATWVYDFYLTRLSSQGEFLWAVECPQVLTGDATVGKLQYLDTDTEGNALLAGFTRGTIDWGNGIVSNTEDFYYNIIIWNVNPQGEISWIKTAAGEGYDDSHSITTDQDGNIYLAGIAGGTSVFDTITFVTDDFVYPFLAKLNTQSITPVNETQPQNELLIYPNPATDVVFLRQESADSYMIFRSDGQKVKEGTMNQGLQTVNIVDLSSGIYFISFNPAASSSARSARLMVR